MRAVCGSITGLLAPLDRALLLTLGPACLLCVALSLQSSPVVWPGVFVGLSLVLAGLVVPAYQRLRPQIDGIVFAKRHAAERGLERLLVDLSACGDDQSLILLAARRLDELLEPVNAALYAGRGDAYEPVFVRGAAPRRFEATSALVAALEQLGRPLTSDLPSLGWMGGGASPCDRAALETLGASAILPIRTGDRLVAFLSLGAKRSGRVYTRTDLSWLTVVTDKLSGELRRIDYSRRIDEQHTRQQSLRRYVPGAVAKQLDRGAELETGVQDVSVLFVDLRGSTAFAEHRRSDEVFATVNRYMGIVTDILHRHGGTVVEFAGDGVLAVFGAPETLPAKERAAVDAGYEIVLAMPSLTQPGAEPLRAGVGIATGPACVGNVRGSDRLIWTVIGDTPNLAARLERLTRDLGADIVIDSATCRKLGAAAAVFECRPRTPIRGRSTGEDVYLLSPVVAGGLQTPPCVASSLGVGRGRPIVAEEAVCRREEDDHFGLGPLRAQLSLEGPRVFTVPMRGLPMSVQAGGTVNGA